MKIIKLKGINCLYAFIDDEDYSLISSLNWTIKHFKGKYYAQSFIASFKRQILMHRLILGITNPDVFTDHKDGFGLNNVKNNLRACSCSQNAMNRTSRKNSTSKYLGVTLSKRRNIDEVKYFWLAAIKVNNKRKHLGVFNNEEDAAKAYDEAAIAEYGEFANPNFK